MLFNFISKRKKKKQHEKNKNKFDINNWMNLTKEERLEIDFKDKEQSMRKKKKLLQSMKTIQRRLVQYLLH